MFLYRVGNWCYRKKLPIIPKLFDAFIRIIHNSAIYSSCSIGEGTVFGYGGIALIIHKDAVVGKNCVIGGNVTIGGKSGAAKLPVIEDNVYIATGAKILGEVVIGKNSVVGANAVVVKDVPPNSVVAGIPAKVIASNIDPKDYS